MHMTYSGRNIKAAHADNSSASQRRRPMFHWARLPSISFNSQVNPLMLQMMREISHINVAVLTGSQSISSSFTREPFFFFFFTCAWSFCQYLFKARWTESSTLLSILVTVSHFSHSPPLRHRCCGCARCCYTLPSSFSSISPISIC